MACTRKQILLDEAKFKHLKKIYCGGIYSRASDSLFLRDLIESLLQVELKK